MNIFAFLLRLSGTVWRDDALACFALQPIAHIQKVVKNEDVSNRACKESQDLKMVEEIWNQVPILRCLPYAKCDEYLGEMCFTWQSSNEMQLPSNYSRRVGQVWIKVCEKNSSR
jgi:hypothetical protein